MTSRELAEVLEKIREIVPLVNDAMDSVAKIIKDELDRTKPRQKGPAKGQRYWIYRLLTVAPYVYEGDDFDINAGKYRDLYPEERFVTAELRAKKLIRDVNKRRRELNEGKEFGDRSYHIVFCKSPGLDVWWAADLANARGGAYPFGLFKDSSDCKMCINEFDDELEWFFKEYLPLMEELDDYDWADAPGWGEED